MEIILRCIGAFYVFAGILVLRGVVMDRVMDQMLAGITMKAQPKKEGLKRLIWGISGMAIGMGGAALMVLNLWAVPLFTVGLLTQVAYLIWARTAFPLETPLEEKGRRQTINAAVLYGIVTGVVVAAALSGQLYPLFDGWAVFIPVTGLVTLALTLRHYIWSPKSRKLIGFGDADDDWQEPLPSEPPPEVSRVRLEARWTGENLVDADTDLGIDEFRYLDGELALRINTWAQAFKIADDMDDRSIWGEFATPQDEAEHRAEGAAIVAALEAVFGPGNVTGPVYPEEIRHTGRATNPGI